MGTRQSANGRALKLAAVARPAHVLLFCQVPNICPLFRYYLPSVYFKALGKEGFCRVQYICRMFPWRHSAHSRFAECPMECTRETLRHSSYLLFLVVSLPQTKIRIITTTSVKKECSQVYTKLNFLSLTRFIENRSNIYVSKWIYYRNIFND